MKSYKLITILITLILCLSIVSAGPFKIDEDLEMGGNEIYNASDLNGTNVWQNGLRVLDASSDLNASKLNISQLNSTNSNQSTYWGPYQNPDSNWFLIDNETLTMNEPTLSDFVWVNITQNNVTVNAWIAYINGTIYVYIDNQNVDQNNSLNLRMDNDNASGTLWTNYKIGSISNDFLNRTGQNNMLGNINMTNHNITNIQRLMAPDGSAIQFGPPGNITGMDQSVTIFNNQILGQGAIVFSLMGKDGSVQIMSQRGRNNSAGFLGNSWVIMPNNLLNLMGNNSLNITDCLKLCDFYNKTCYLECDTSGYGASGMIHGGLHIWRELFVDEGINNFGYFNHFGEGSGFDIFNDSVHIISRFYGEEVTTNIGPIDLVDATFSGQSGTDISPFVKTAQVGTDANNWFIASSPSCFSNPCVRANGGNGVSQRIMETYVNTSNVTGITLSFYYGSAGMTSSNNDNFTVLMNPNNGTGFVQIWTNTTTIADIAPPILKTFSIATEFENQSNITLRFIHTGQNTGRQTYLDNILLNGTTGTPVLQNISKFDSQICVGEGEESSPGVCKEAIYFNDTSKQFIFRGGNITFDLVTEQELNVTSSITLQGETINKWVEVSNYISGYNNATWDLAYLFVTNGSFYTKSDVDANITSAVVNMTAYTNAQNETMTDFNLFLNQSVSQRFDSLPAGSGSFQNGSDINVTNILIEEWIYFNATTRMGSNTTGWYHIQDGQQRVISNSTDYVIKVESP